MGFGESFKPFADGSISVVQQYSWVLWIFVPIALAIFGGWMWKSYQEKNKQWTHKLKVRQVIGNNDLTDTAIIRMRRYPLIRSGEVFELEHAFLGSYLISELDSYSGRNEYSVIIDKNNRVYTNKGEKFCPDSQSVNVSAKHSEIDITLGEFKKKYQEVHKTQKRVEWGQIAKAAIIGLALIVVLVLGIKWIDNAADNHAQDANKAAAEAETFRQMTELMETVEGVINVQLILVDEIKELKGTNNVQGIVRSVKNESI